MMTIKTNGTTDTRRDGTETSTGMTRGTTGKSKPAHNLKRGRVNVALRERRPDDGELRYSVTRAARTEQ